MPPLRRQFFPRSRQALPQPQASQRLAWLEGMRIVAAILILIYHYQLFFTDYAFAPQPTGLMPNLERLWNANQKLGSGWGSWISLISWFGYQFVDVFILISGFSLVLSLKGQPLKTAAFLRQRLLRILLPFWTVAWLAYPVLWVIGKSTHTYIPSKWSIFSGITFPLLFEYDGQQLLPTCGPWWFIPLILSFTGVFPLLWKLQQRWGIRNLCGIAALLTIVYRTIAIYLLDGHPTYVMFASNTGAHPFMPFLAKFITFVIGMAVALQYQQWRGALFWPATWALAMGVSIYSVGFLMQFYQAGWILADSCIAVGLSLCCMLLLRFLSDHLHLSRIFRWLGKHSYSFFLIHNFVADRLIRLVVKGDLQAYYTFLPITIGLTLGLAILVDRLTPKIAAHGSQLLYQIDQHLSQPPKSSPPKPFRPMQPISTAVRRQLR